MAKDPEDYKKIVLRCKKNDDGSLDGDIYEDGVPNPRMTVRSGTCLDIQDLGVNARDAYGQRVIIDPSCQECFSDRNYLDS